MTYRLPPNIGRATASQTKAGASSGGGDDGPYEWKGPAGVALKGLGWVASAPLIEQALAVLSAGQTAVDRGVARPLVSIGREALQGRRGSVREALGLGGHESAYLPDYAGEGPKRLGAEFLYGLITDPASWTLVGLGASAPRNVAASTARVAARTAARTVATDAALAAATVGKRAGGAAARTAARGAAAGAARSGARSAARAARLSRIFTGRGVRLTNRELAAALGEADQFDTMAKVIVEGTGSLFPSARKGGAAARAVSPLEPIGLTRPQVLVGLPFAKTGYAIRGSEVIAEPIFRAKAAVRKTYVKALKDKGALSSLANVFGLQQNALRRAAVNALASGSEEAYAELRKVYAVGPFKDVVGGKALTDMRKLIGKEVASVIDRQASFVDDVSGVAKVVEKKGAGTLLSARGRKYLRSVGRNLTNAKGKVDGGAWHLMRQLYDTEEIMQRAIDAGAAGSLNRIVETVARRAAASAAVGARREVAELYQAAFGSLAGMFRQIDAHVADVELAATLKMDMLKAVNRNASNFGKVMVQYEGKGKTVLRRGAARVLEEAAGKVGVLASSIQPVMDDLSKILAFHKVMNEVIEGTGELAPEAVRMRKLAGYVGVIDTSGSARLQAEKAAAAAEPVVDAVGPFTREASKLPQETMRDATRNVVKRLQKAEAERQAILNPPAAPPKRSVVDKVADAAEPLTQEERDQALRVANATRSAQLKAAIAANAVKQPAAGAPTRTWRQWLKSALGEGAQDPMDLLAQFYRGVKKNIKTLSKGEATAARLADYDAATVAKVGKRSLGFEDRFRRFMKIGQDKTTKSRAVGAALTERPAERVRWVQVSKEVRAEVSRVQAMVSRLVDLVTNDKANGFPAVDIAGRVDEMATKIDAMADMLEQRTGVASASKAQRGLREMWVQAADKDEVLGRERLGVLRRLQGKQADLNRINRKNGPKTFGAAYWKQFSKDEQDIITKALGLQRGAKYADVRDALREFDRTTKVPQPIYELLTKRAEEFYATLNPDDLPLYRNDVYANAAIVTLPSELRQVEDQIQALRRQARRLRGVANDPEVPGAASLFDRLSPADKAKRYKPGRFAVRVDDRAATAAAAPVADAPTPAVVDLGGGRKLQVVPKPDKAGTFIRSTEDGGSFFVDEIQTVRYGNIEVDGDTLAQWLGANEADNLEDAVLKMSAQGLARDLTPPPSAPVRNDLADTGVAASQGAPEMPSRPKKPRARKKRSLLDGTSETLHSVAITDLHPTARLHATLLYGGVAKNGYINLQQQYWQRIIDDLGESAARGDQASIDAIESIRSAQALGAKGMKPLKPGDKVLLGRGIDSDAEDLLEVTVSKVTRDSFEVEEFPGDVISRNATRGTRLGMAKERPAQDAMEANLEAQRQELQRLGRELTDLSEGERRSLRELGEAAAAAWRRGETPVMVQYRDYSDALHDYSLVGRADSVDMPAAADEVVAPARKVIKPESQETPGEWWAKEIEKEFGTRRTPVDATPTTGETVDAMADLQAKRAAIKNRPIEETVAGTGKRRRAVPGSDVRKAEYRARRNEVNKLLGDKNPGTWKGIAGHINVLTKYVDGFIKMIAEDKVYGFPIGSNMADYAAQQAQKLFDRATSYERRMVTQKLPKGMTKAKVQAKIDELRKAGDRLLEVSYDPAVPGGYERLAKQLSDTGETTRRVATAEEIATSRGPQQVVTVPAFDRIRYAEKPAVVENLTDAELDRLYGGMEALYMAQPASVRAAAAAELGLPADAPFDTVRAAALKLGATTRMDQLPPAVSKSMFDSPEILGLRQTVVERNLRNAENAAKVAPINERMKSLVDEYNDAVSGHTVHGRAEALTAAIRNELGPEIPVLKEAHARLRRIESWTAAILQKEEQARSILEGRRTPRMKQLEAQLEFQTGRLEQAKAAGRSDIVDHYKLRLEETRAAIDAEMTPVVNDTVTGLIGQISELERRRNLELLTLAKMTDGYAAWKTSRAGRTASEAEIIKLFESEVSAARWGRDIITPTQEKVMHGNRTVRWADKPTGLPGDTSQQYMAAFVRAVGDSAIRFRANHWIDDETFRTIARVLPVDEDADKIANLTNRFVEVTRLWRAQALLSPAFSNKNFLGGFINNLSEGVRPKWYRYAAEQSKKPLDELSPASQWLRMRFPDAFEAENVGLDTMSVGQRGADVSFSDPTIMRTMAALSDTFDRMTPARRLLTGLNNGQRVEANLRAALFHKLVEVDGLTYEMAWDRVKRIHIDYNDLSKAEISARRVMTFYTFLARNAGLQAELMTRNFSFVNRLGDIRDEQEQIGPIGMQQDLLTVGDMSINIGDLVPGIGFRANVQNPRNFITEMVGGVNPVIRALPQMMAGQDIATGQKYNYGSLVNDLFPSIVKVDQLIGGGIPGGSKTKYQIDNPIQRFIMVALGITPRQYVDR